MKSSKVVEVLVPQLATILTQFVHNSAKQGVTVNQVMFVMVLVHVFCKVLVESVEQSTCGMKQTWFGTVKEHASIHVERGKSTARVGVAVRRAMFNMAAYATKTAFADFGARQSKTTE